MNFIVIDFETATAKRDSACELGLAVVQDNIIVESRSWMIKPPYNEYNYQNIRIHGIQPHDTEDSPSFGEIWHEVLPYLEGQFVIAHNASFDFSVLRACLETAHLPYPNIDYACSVAFAKRIWSHLPAHNLGALARHCNIEFNHHRACDDAVATAEIIFAIFKDGNIEKAEDLTTKYGIALGSIYERGYKACRSLKPKKVKQKE